MDVEASGERAVAAGGSIGMVVTGDTFLRVDRITAQLPAEAYELPACTTRVVNLPDRPDVFVGREAELDALDAAFEGADQVVVHAVHGLGGIGKSTLAAHWAAGRADTWNPVWWINAETPADLDAGLADLAVAFRPALGDQLSRRVLRDLAVQWLCTHDGWLLILDNVADPADVKPLLGRATRGRFLVTTRRAEGWRGIAEKLPLDVLTLPKAVELFAAVHGRPFGRRDDDGTDLDDVGELCRDLGCLPLAVEQAAAYCREAAITPARYRRQLAEYPQQLLAQAPEGGRAVARVWRVTLDRLVDTPLAGEILRVIAWWAPDGIHRSYLDPLGSPPEVTEALRRLAAHSMITLHGDEISVHRLVQAVARAADPADPHRLPESVVAARESAATLLNGPTGPTEDSARAMQTRWYSHAEAFLGHGEPDTEQSALLFVTVVRWRCVFHEEGGVAALWHALGVARRVCGLGHTTTLLARENVAEEYLATGQWVQAQLLLRQNMFTAYRRLERAHPVRIMAYARLAGPMLRKGNAFAALGTLDRALRKAERALGPDHDVTVRIGIMLAKTATHLGRIFPRRYAPRVIPQVERLRARADIASDAALLFTTYLVSLHTSTGDHERAVRTTVDFADELAGTHGERHVSTLYARAEQVSTLEAYGETDLARAVLDPLRADWEEAVEDTRLPASLREAMTRMLRTLLPPRTD
ncbi:ATP-binding protein [Streptomyces sp. MA5143a]|uniref:ATP-binding protein n=1 Tax=Streptomyces sp. MA5143a TaxID=2083010 RepID=UPI000D1BD738|nr:ATP-binding protein [Streptomyces sp. MA5143a]SPF04573.1 Regulatory protein AfsR [Streptomyces sp. MA5143a]